MIKFIATDLDGTLLDGEGRLPEAVFPLIEKLHARGILFAPASGRQYANLKMLFAPVENKVLFICENGALIKYRGETLHLSPIPDGALEAALHAIRAIPHLYPLLSGANTAYIEDDAEPFATLSRAAYTNCERVDRLTDVIGREPVCKIAVYDEKPAAQHCIRLLPHRLPALRTILSGERWCDVSFPEANKGEAIRFIQDHFGFKREECLAFGDHMNDFEMLLACGEAYVPENAYPPLKEQIGRTVPANTAGGVITKLKEILKEN